LRKCNRKWGFFHLVELADNRDNLETESSQYGRRNRNQNKLKKNKNKKKKKKRERERKKKIIIIIIIIKSINLNCASLCDANSPLDAWNKPLV
jgi:hypothetical protein